MWSKYGDDAIQDAVRAIKQKKNLNSTSG